MTFTWNDSIPICVIERVSSTQTPRVPTNNTISLCPSFPVPQNGEVALRNAYFPGSIATFRCDPGYNLIGSAVLTCETATSQWNGTVPTCELPSTTTTATTTATTASATAQTTPITTTIPEVLPCPNITKPNNGEISVTNDTLPGSIAMFECDPGYEIVGANASRCDESTGTWSEQFPICKRIQTSPRPSSSPIPYTTTESTTSIAPRCPDIPMPKNGEMNLSDGLSPGSEASFSCHHGYILRGAKEISCSNETLTWSGEFPVCTRQRYIFKPTMYGDRRSSNYFCPTIAMPRNGYYFLSNAYLPGSVASFFCNDGFLLEGWDQIKCDFLTLTWNHQVPACQPRHSHFPFNLKLPNPWFRRHQWLFNNLNRGIWWNV